MSYHNGPRIVTDGLVIYVDAGNSKSYPGTGTSWYDISGSGNDGTLINDVGFNSDNGGSLVFDGVNDYVNCGSISSQFTANVTAETWIYLSSQSGDWVRIIGTGGVSGNITFGLWYSSGGRLLWQRYGASDPSIFPVSPILSTGVWHHIVATTSESSHVLYLNGSFR